MSVLLMAKVWRLAGLSRSERDVLLALADHAHDDGTSAKPGVPYLMWKLDLGRNTVIRALAGLEEQALIVPVTDGVRGRKGGGRGRVTEYLLDLDSGTEKTPPKALNRPKRGVNRPKVEPKTVPNGLAREEEPPIEPPEGTNAAAAGNPRPPNPIWDVLSEIFGEPLDRFASHHGLVVKNIRELLIRDGIRDTELAKAEVRRRHQALLGSWGRSRASKDALVRHWQMAGQLADEGASGGLSPEQIYEQALEHEEGERHD